MNLIDHARFFIVYPVGLEDLGLLELKEKFSMFFPDQNFKLISEVPGGIEIECLQYIGFQLNSLLRTPTRILLRIHEFKCRDAPKLFQKISKFNWSPWLIGQTPAVEVATIRSRLFDSRKIEKAIQDGVLQYYRHKPVKKKYLEYLNTIDATSTPKIYFRSVEDLCTLSLDTTGERLHIRNEKILTGLAPIRENLAALLLMELKTHLKPEKYTLIDPMCGSGTFLLEAHASFTGQLNREFSYYHLPVYLDQKLSIKSLENKNADNIFNSFIGLEINPEVVKLTKINCKNTPIQIIQKDLFTSQASQAFDSINPIVILNPPYGIRVGERGDGASEINLAYYYKIIEFIKQNITPSIMGIIIPDDFKLKSNSDFKIKSVRPFKNGGLDVSFYVLEFK